MSGFRRCHDGNTVITFMKCDKCKTTKDVISDE